MRLCSKMDNTINLLTLHQFIKRLKVAYIHLYKLVIRFILHILKICKITCICKFIQINDIILRIFVYKEPYNVRAYKTSSTYMFITFLMSLNLSPASFHL